MKDEKRSIILLVLTAATLEEWIQHFELIVALSKKGAALFPIQLGQPYFELPELLHFLDLFLPDERPDRDSFRDIAASLGDLFELAEHRRLPETIRRIDALYRAGKVGGAIVATSDESIVAMIAMGTESSDMPLIKLELEQGSLRATSAHPLNEAGRRSEIFSLLTSFLLIELRSTRYKALEPDSESASETASPSMPARRRPPVSLGLPEYRRPVRPKYLRKERRHHAGGPPKEVHLGTAAPPGVNAGEEFVVRFAAYTAEYRSEIDRIIEEEAPTAKPRLDLETCRWHPGAKVTVQLNASHVEVSNPVQTFTWNGTWRILRFDAKVSVDIDLATIILKLDVAVEGLPLVSIRPEIAILREEKNEKKKTTDVTVTELPAPRSAFASYTKKDRRDVLSRVRSLQIFTGIDVFLDCLSLRPGDEWKPRLKDEICRRDIFWLFWSRSAMASPWVEWEWRTALAAMTLAKIQPHPLEPTEDAPPPKELSDLQFGALYEWYLSQLRESALKRLVRVAAHKAAWWMRWRRRA